MFGISAATIICLLIGVVSTAAITYKLNTHFWSSNYAKTNKSGDFGSPRGGVFALMLPGMIIGAVFIDGVARFVPTLDGAAVFIACLIAGMVSGFSAMARAKNNATPNTPDTNDKNDTNGTK